MVLPPIVDPDGPSPPYARDEPVQAGAVTVVYRGTSQADGRYSARFDVTGSLRYAGIVCSLGIAAGLKRGEAALLGIILSVLFGDAVEEWFKARCPECGMALQLVAALA